MTQFENWGDYFWPDQIDDSKINKLGIRDQGVLEQVERSRSAERAIEIIAGDVAITPTYDLAHLRAIHRQLFQDVYVSVRSRSARRWPDVWRGCREM